MSLTLILAIVGGAAAGAGVLGLAARLSPRVAAALAGGSVDKAAGGGGGPSPQLPK